MRTKRQSRSKRGFLLMEVVLAIGIFAIAATGFAVALARTADAAALAQRRMQITRILDSSLREAVSLPVLEEGTTTNALREEIGGAAVEVDTTIEILNELENQDGKLLQQMFRIEVAANWYEDGQWKNETAETWRYGRLYQP
ncbi:type II secretion system protein [Haloferula sp.]|uniref:type II secretion system protein n=1 Tax=Haloferula sp. TaxID=2497595 RepID=UPI0032A0EAC3